MLVHSLWCKHSILSLSLSFSLSLSLSGTCVACSLLAMCIWARPYIFHRCHYGIWHFHQNHFNSLAKYLYSSRSAIVLDWLALARQCRRHIFTLQFKQQVEVNKYVTKVIWREHFYHTFNSVQPSTTVASAAAAHTSVSANTAINSLVLSFSLSLLPWIELTEVLVVCKNLSMNYDCSIFPVSGVYGCQCVCVMCVCDPRWTWNTELCELIQFYVLIIADNFWFL